MELVGQEVKFRYRHYATDKYNRSIFEVDEPKLLELYTQCIENGKNISLFRPEEADVETTSLLLVISNFSGDDLTGQRVYCRDYKGNIRFYVKKDWRSL